jgi:hypothetical protein
MLTVTTTHCENLYFVLLDHLPALTAQQAETGKLWFDTTSPEDRLGLRRWVDGVCMPQAQVRLRRTGASYAIGNLVEMLLSVYPQEVTKYQNSK